MYKSLNQHLQERFGTKVYKIALSSGCTCPNRDGTVGVGGCIFCADTGSGDFAQSAELPIKEQIKLAKEKISAKNKDGISELKNAITDLIGLKKITGKSVMLSNVRHIAAVDSTKAALEGAKETLLSGMPMDMCAIDVAAALDNIGLITGVSVSADIVDKIFQEFCVGK